MILGRNFCAHILTKRWLDVLLYKLILEMVVNIELDWDNEQDLIELGDNEVFVDFILEDDNIVLKTPLQPNERLSVRKLEENNG